MTTLLEIIERLSNTRPLSQRAIEEALDVAMRGDPENVNRYIFVMKSFRVPKSLTAVELRVPLAGATRKDGLLIVDVDPEQEPIDAAQVKQRFGDHPEIELPTPEQPADAPVYLSYAKPWGALRFGFARPSNGLLPAHLQWELVTTIVVDAER